MSESEKIQKLSDMFLNGLQQTFKSDNFNRYLRFVSRFYGYSIRNTILILSQFENAKRVEIYDNWKKLGRYVKRGEKGTAVFVPSKVKIKKNDIEQTLIKFHIRYVYDISQTDGEPLPEICNKLYGNIDNFEMIFNAVKKISPYKIVFEQFADKAKGYCDYKNKKIAIQMGLSDEQIIKTLISEFSNCVIHEEKEKRKELQKVEAESTAFIVSNFFGIDTSDYSFEYITDLSKNLKIGELQTMLEKIQKAANQIISSINKEMKILEKGKDIKEYKQRSLQERIMQAAEKSNELKNEKELNGIEKNIHE
jgi:antirestriction protein ArdC